MCAHVHVEAAPISAYDLYRLLVGPVRISVQVPAAPASLLTEHVDATGQKTGIEEGAEDRPRNPLFLRAHRAP